MSSTCPFAVSHYRYRLTIIFSHTDPLPAPFFVVLFKNSLHSSFFALLCFVSLCVYVGVCARVCVCVYIMYLLFITALTEWYIQSGCTGLFATCLSSEMYNLSREERLELARHVAAKAAGRVSVVASGTFEEEESSVEAQAEFVRAMAKHVDAVVVIVANMAKEDEDNSIWRSNVQKLLDLTPGVPLGLYECPRPYHRLLDADTLSWCAATGRFLFHKDTCCVKQGLADKLSALNKLDSSTPFRFYNANVATVLYSDQRGGSGFSGICANFYPQVMVWLTANTTHPRAPHVQKMLAVCENVVCCKYPTSAKAYLNMFEGFETEAVARCQDVQLNEEELLKLDNLHYVMGTVCEELSIPVLNPAQFL